MRVKWDNVIIAALLFFAFVITLKNLPQLVGLVSKVRTVGARGAPAEDQILGIGVLCIIGWTLVAIVKLTLRNRNQ